jgi:hypothetical protein
MKLFAPPTLLRVAIDAGKLSEDSSGRLRDADFAQTESSNTRPDRK